MTFDLALSNSARFDQNSVFKYFVSPVARMARLVLIPTALELVIRQCNLLSLGSPLVGLALAGALLVSLAYAPTCAIQTTISQIVYIATLKKPLERLYASCGLLAALAIIFTATQGTQGNLLLFDRRTL